jgi:hypothetical protein
MFIYFAAAFIVIPLVWVSLKFAPWAAPLSGVLGLAVGVVSTSLGFYEGMKWGFGLFGFSMIVFLLGGGMRGR